MKKIVASFFVVALLAFISCTQKTEDFPGENEDLKLWYSQPAGEWMLEALPIGNGSIGAMIFGGVGREHIQFNEKSLWSGRPMNAPNPDYQQKMDSIKEMLAMGKVPEANQLMQEAGGFSREHFGEYQPFGDIHLEFDHGDSATEYYRELDLSRALLTVSYRIDGVEYRREYFASFLDQSIVMRISADAPAKIDMKVTKTTPHEETKVVADSDMNLILSGSMPESGLEFASLLKVKAQGGKTSTKSGEIEVKGANSVVLVLSAKTSYAMSWPTCKSNIDPEHWALEQAEKASKKSYDHLLKAHLDDYTALFNRVQFKLDRPADRRALSTDQALIAYTNSNEENYEDGGDPGLEALLFHYGRYLMISSSREGALPANLQGMWNNSLSPAWSCDYHTDINIEMNYWINGPTNLSECFSPFTEYVDFLREAGRKTAEDYFNAKGFFVNIYTNPWAYAEPRWPWMGAGGWLCQNLYDHFLFSGNMDYLREKAYPIMKEACLFYLDLLVPYKDESLVVVPGVSPEINFLYDDQKFYRISAGASVDQQIVYDLFTNTIEAAQILKEDESLIGLLEDRLKRLSPPVKIAGDGSIQEWIEDWKQEDSLHRHISHLYALYPGRMIDPDISPEYARAAEKSLEIRGDNHTGWGTAWRIACFARLGQGERAHDFFKSLIRHCEDTGIVYRGGGGTYANMLTCHSPFQIDSNFGYTAAVAEMLLQSHLGNWREGPEIKLLPALPRAWPDGEVKGLLARGGFTIDMEWKSGKLVYASILSSLGKSAKMTYGEKTIELEMAKGESLSLDSELKVISLSNN